MTTSTLEEPATAVADPLEETPALETEPEPLEAGPTVRPVRVGWMADKHTVGHLGGVLKPLAVGLMDELVDLTAFCPRNVAVDELPSPPVNVVSYGKFRWLGFSTGAKDELFRQMRSRKIELLHALDAATAGLTRQLAERLGVPYIVSCNRVGDGRHLHTLHASAVIATSEPIRRDLIENHIAPATDIHLVRPGVYLARKATCFKNPDQRVAIVAGGELESLSSLQALLRSFGDLHERNYGCQYFIIGTGRAERPLRSLADKLDIRNELTFIGPQTGLQYANILKAADIYISPAPASELDIHALQAMAAGDPVLAARNSREDFFIDGKTILQFRAGRSEELTMKLLSLLEDHAVARGLAESALDYLREHHSPARMVQETATLYRSATEK